MSLQMNDTFSMLVDINRGVIFPYKKESNLPREGVINEPGQNFHFNGSLPSI